MIACLCHGASACVPDARRRGQVRVNVGEAVAEQLRRDLEAERAAVSMRNDGIELRRTLGDIGSRDLLEEILRAEEHHIDWSEAQLPLIQRMGEAHCLAQRVRDEA